MQFIEATAFQDKVVRRPEIVCHRRKPSLAEANEARFPVPETNWSHRLRNQTMIIAGLIGVLCVALSGCGSKAAGHEEEVRPVQVITASYSAAAVGATYSGEIRARYESKLGFKVSGKVIARLVEVGSKVVQGQVLLELDPQDASLSAASAAAQTEAARAKLQQSRLDLDREDRLYRERFISKACIAPADQLITGARQLIIQA